VHSKDAEQIEIRRVWERQQLSVLECCPKIYHDVVRWIDEGRGVVAVMNKIDEALDRAPTTASQVTAATAAFDRIRTFVDAQQRASFVDLVGRVNRGLAKAGELKALLFDLARRLNANSLLEGTYFDDVRQIAERA
jgi:hypothetical protein